MTPRIEDGNEHLLAYVASLVRGNANPATLPDGSVRMADGLPLTDPYLALATFARRHDEGCIQCPYTYADYRQDDLVLPAVTGMGLDADAFWLLVLFCYDFTRSLEFVVRTPADTMQDSIIYLRIYFAGILFVLIYNMGSAILRATGDSKRPLYYLIICCIINIVLDCLFVIVFHMGVMGAAVATLIAQAVSAVLVTRDLMRSRDILHLSLRCIRFHGTVLKTQLKMGIPTGLESVLFSITNIAIMASINTFGTDTTAAWSAYGKLDAIFWMVSTAFGISITTFVGQNYGAGKMDRVRRSTWVCLLIDLAVSGVLVLFLVAAREILFHMFTADTDVIRIGCNMLILIIPWYIVYVVIEVLAGALRGVGDVIVPMVITLTGVCLFRIIWLAVVMKVSPTIPAIIYSYPVTWTVSALAFIVYYIRKYRRR